MENFWESSPLYQRRQELAAELDQATKAKDVEGERVLACIQNDNDSRHGNHWQRVRQTYKDAVERYEDAFAAWDAAYKAFDASPAGQAKERYFARLRADRIARESALVSEAA